MSDEDFDPFVGGPPPDPSERTWRHPSEVAAEARANAAEPPSRSRRPAGATLLIAGSLGAAACLTVIALVQTVSADGGATTGVVAAPPLFDIGDEDSTTEIATTVTAPSTTSTAIATTSSSTNGSGVPAPDAAVASADSHLVSITSDGTEVGSGVLIGDRLITSAAMADERLSVSYRRPGHEAESTAYLVGIDAFSDLAVYRPSARTMASQTLDALSSDTEATNDPTTDPSGTMVVLASVDPTDPTGPPLTSVGLITSVGTERTGADGQALVGLIDTNLRQPENGGLLLGLDGRLLGIVIDTTSTLASAVPIEDAVVIADHLAERGWASEAWIGFMGMDVPGGVEVVDVDAGSPAERAGLLPGDIVIFLGSSRVDHMAGITAHVRRSEPGEALVFLVDRHGEPMAITIETVSYGVDIPVSDEQNALDQAQVTEPASG